MEMYVKLLVGGKWLSEKNLPGYKGVRNFSLNLYGSKMHLFAKSVLSGKYTNKHWQQFMGNFSSNSLEEK